MNRRTFLRRFAAGAVGAAAIASGFDLDPERALWQPGQVKTFDLGAMPKGPLRDADLGLSIRFVKEFEAFSFVNRLDILYGWSVVRPDLCVRISA